VLHGYICVCVCVCVSMYRRPQSKDTSCSRLLTDSVSSTSSRDSPVDDVIDRCSGDVTPPGVDDVATMTSRAADTVPAQFHRGTVPPPPTILLSHGTVPEVLDYRSMLVGAALARQEIMTSLGNDYAHQKHHQHFSDQFHHHPHNRHHQSRRFTPYVITNDFIPSGFGPT